MKKVIVICAVAGLILAAGNVAQAAFTGWVSPTANSPVPGNLGFNVPYAAYADGPYPGNWNAEINQFGYGHTYYGYDFSAIPDGATINGIQVKLDAWYNSTYVSSGSIAVELSWDNGTNWTTTGYGTGALTSAEQSYILGGTSNTWSTTHTWTATEIETAFRVRLVATVNDGTTNLNPDLFLDWVPVEVAYIPVPEPTTIALLGFGSLALLRKRRV